MFWVHYSIDAFIGSNRRNISVYGNGHSFKTSKKSTNLDLYFRVENGGISYAVFTPAVKRSSIQAGVRCLFSMDSSVLIGFLVGSSSLVLFDL